MLKLTLKEFDLQLERFYSKYLKERTESLRTKILDSPTQWPEDQDPTRLWIKAKKQRHWIVLALMSWYAPEEVRFLLQLELLEHKQWDVVDFDLGELLLTSKSYALGYVLEQEFWNESDFFGNVLNKEFVTIWMSLDFARISTRKVPRYSGYCRGYQDSSRRAPSPLPLELRAKSSVEEELERQELARIHLLYWKEKVKERISA
jgi:hypothetical protein